MSFESDLLSIYDAYPRKVARRTALLEIERALRRLQAGEVGLKMTHEQAVEELIKATALYAHSPAAQRGRLTPHPTTWFHQSRYLDDPQEWQHLTSEESKQCRSHMEANIGVYIPS